MAAAFDVNIDLDSGHVCACCSERLELLEEVVLLQVVLPANPNGEMTYYIIENEDGDYAYEPYFFHQRCWEEEIDDALSGRREDEPPILCEGGIVECDGCTSDILPWETSATLTIGELQRSQRNPEGEYRVMFKPHEAAPQRVLCISCLNVINDEILEMWEGGITHRYACAEGVHCRCWRYECCDNPGQEGCRLTREGV